MAAMPFGRDRNPLSPEDTRSDEYGYFEVVPSLTLLVVWALIGAVAGVVAASAGAPFWASAVVAAVVAGTLVVLETGSR